MDPEVIIPEPNDPSCQEKYSNNRENISKHNLRDD
jgi:hypothetical protein